MGGGGGTPAQDVLQGFEQLERRWDRLERRSAARLAEGRALRGRLGPGPGLLSTPGAGAAPPELQGLQGLASPPAAAGHSVVSPGLGSPILGPAAAAQAGLVQNLAGVRQDAVAEVATLRAEAALLAGEAQRLQERKRSAETAAESASKGLTTLQDQVRTAEDRLREVQLKADEEQRKLELERASIRQTVQAAEEQKRRVDSASTMIMDREQRVTASLLDREHDLRRQEIDLMHREQRIASVEAAAATYMTRERSLEQRESALRDREGLVKRAEGEVQNLRVGLEQKTQLSHEALARLKADVHELDNKRSSLTLHVQELEAAALGREEVLKEAARKSEKKKQDAEETVSQLRHESKRVDLQLREKENLLATAQGDLERELKQLKLLRRETSNAEDAHAKATKAEREAQAALKAAEAAAQKSVNAGKAEVLALRNQFDAGMAEVAALRREHERLEKGIEAARLTMAKEREEFESRNRHERSAWLEEQDTVRREIEKLAMHHADQKADWERKVGEKEAELLRRQAEAEMQDLKLSEASQRLSAGEVALEKTQQVLAEKMAGAEGATEAALDERRELQRKANALIVHEENLNAWKEQLKAEALKQLKERETVMSDWEARLTREEAAFKDEVALVQKKQAARDEELLFKEQKLKGAEEKLQAVKAEAEAKEAELLGLEAQAKEIMEVARERKQAMEIERVKFDNELKDMERVKGGMAEERAGLDGRDATLAEAEARFKEAQEAVDEKSLELADAQRKLDAQVAETDERAAKAGALKAAADAAEAEATAKTKEAESVLQAASDWEAQKQQLEQELQAREEKIEQERLELVQMAETASTQVAAANAAKDALVTAEQALDERESKLQDSWRILRGQALSAQGLSAGPLREIQPLLAEDAASAAVEANNWVPPPNASLPSDPASVAAQDLAGYLQRRRAFLLERETRLQRWAFALETEATRQGVSGEALVADVDRARAQLEQQDAKQKELAEREERVAAEAEANQALLTEAQDLSRKAAEQKEAAEKDGAAVKELQAALGAEKEQAAMLTARLNQKEAGVDKAALENEAAKQQNEQAHQNIKGQEERLKDTERALQQKEVELHSLKEKLADKENTVENRSKAAEAQERALTKTDADLRVKAEELKNREKNADMQLEAVRHKEISMEREKVAVDAKVAAVASREEAVRGEKMALEREKREVEALASKAAAVAEAERRLAEKEIEVKQNAMRADELLSRADRDRAAIETDMQRVKDALAQEAAKHREQKASIEDMGRKATTLLEQANEAKAELMKNSANEEVKIENLREAAKLEHTRLLDNISQKEKALSLKVDSVRQREDALRAAEARISQDKDTYRKLGEDVYAQERKVREELDRIDMERRKMTDENKTARAELERQHQYIKEQQLELRARIEAATKAEAEAQGELRALHYKMRDEERDVHLRTYELVSARQWSCGGSRLDPPAAPSAPFPPPLTARLDSDPPRVLPSGEEAHEGTRARAYVHSVVHPRRVPPFPIAAGISDFLRR